MSEERDTEKLKISLIIPVYNAEKTIERCLRSIIAQRFADMECLCIDDGSSDRTAEIIYELSQQDERIRYILQEHGGQGKARNTGLAAACGKYILYIDCDDEIDAHTLEILWKNAEENQADVVLFGFTLVRNTGEREIYKIKNFSGDRRLFFEQKMQPLYKSFLMNAPWNKLIRRSILLESGVRFRTDMHMYEDTEFSLEVSLAAEKIVGISDVLYTYYYLREGSLTSTFFDDTDRNICIIGRTIEGILSQYQLDEAYFYSDMVHKMVCFASAVRRKTDISFWKRIVKLCNMFSTEQMVYYLKHAKTDIVILRKQIVFLRMISPPMLLVASIFGKGYCDEILH